jgi:methionine biosynthesis protein MetW
MRLNRNPLRYGGQSYDSHEAPGIIVDLVEPGARVLDVGCGTGSITALIASLKHAKVTGIEPDPSRAEVARLRGIEVITGEFEHAAAELSAEFDVIVFADVLEHLYDPLDALSTARQLLKPGGAVIVSVPNVAHWTVRRNLLLGRFDYQEVGIMDETHIRWFTRRTLHDLLEQGGFEWQVAHGSSGTWMPEYAHELPWKLLPAPIRKQGVRALAKAWPTLFGCQHVVKAQLASKPANAP